MLSTKVLQKAIEGCKKPPEVWLNSSTATIYVHSETTPMNEEQGITGNDFSMNVAKQWESCFFKKKSAATRKVALRTSIVFGKQGGAFIPLKKLTQFGFGGKQGKGNQMVSWIHETDFARSIEFIISKPEIDVTVNVTAPNPVQNEYLMRNIRTTLKIPFGINIPRFFLEIGAFIIRTETELVLKSRYVIPERLQNHGFQFTYPNLKSALKNLLDKD